MATSTRSSRRSKGTFRSGPQCLPLSCNRPPVRVHRPGHSRSLTTNSGAYSAFASSTSFPRRALTSPMSLWREPRGLPMIRSSAPRILAAVVGTALLTVVNDAGAQQAASVEVDIKNFSFAPETLTVAPGTTVTWVNQDDEPHTTASTGEPRVFRSPGMDTGEKYTFVFDKPGTYPYICSIHPYM